MRGVVLRLGVAALLLGAANPAGSDGPEAPAGWTVRDVDDPFAGTELQGIEKATHVAIRVVDAKSGRGVAGAKLYLAYEELHRLSAPLGLSGDPLIATTDAFGWARLEADEFAFHPYVIAAGYAPTKEWEEGAVYRLWKGHDLALDLRGPLERPVAGALVGWRLYCGHTPDVVQATTDEAGHAVLPHVDDRETKWVWPVAAGFASDDFDVGDATPFSSRSTVLRLAPGPVVEGRVLDAKGAPVSGAFVGARGFHRGPWTKTGADGGFRLVGAEPFDELQVDPNDEEFDSPRSARATAPPAGIPLVVRLPGEGPPASAAPSFEVKVRLFDPDTHAPLDVLSAHRDPDEPDDDGVELLAWRTTDGLVKASEPAGEDEPGERRFRLAAGAWIVRADGRRFGRASVSAALEVVGPTSLDLSPWRLPELAVDATTLGEDDTVTLATAAVVRDVTAEAKAGRVRAPEGEEAVLRVARLWRTRVVPVPRGPRDPKAPPLVLTPPSPTVVSARFVGPDGKPAEARTRITSYTELRFADQMPRETLAPTHAVAIPTDEVGRMWFVAVPEDPALAGRVVEVDLGAGDDPSIDLGEIRFPKREDCRLEFVRSGHSHDAIARKLSMTGADGLVRWAPARPGEREEEFLAYVPPPDEVLVARLAGSLPVHVSFDRPGPWTVTWPAGALWVFVPGAEGTATSVQVLVDGERFSTASGSVGPTRGAIVDVDGIPAGEHRVLVCAPGRKAREYTATWAEGEEKRLEARLDPLPPTPPGPK